MDNVYTLILNSLFEKEKRGILSNSEKVNVKKEGSGIIPYWITVLGVSAPFIYFTTRYAERINLKKREILVITSLLCIVSLMFPSYMQQGQIIIWGLLAGGILILPSVIVAIRNRGRKTGQETSQEAVALIYERELACGQSVFSEVEEANEVEEKLSEVEETIEVEECFLEVHGELRLEESLEKGFQAKEEGNYQLAAEWFIYTLDRKPLPDIAFYLIIDSYGLLTNTLSSDKALNRVKPYIIEYFKGAPPEWCIELMEWLEKEKIRINF